MSSGKTRHRTSIIIASVITLVIIASSILGLMYLHPDLLSGRPDTRSVMDLAGNNVTIPNEIKRVAVGRPLLVEILMMLNAEERLVGFSDANSLPWMRKIFPGIVDVNRTFTYSDVIIEALIQAHPDVVFTCVGDRITEPIIAAGIPCIQISKLNDQDFMKSILLMGELFGPESYVIATKYVEYFQEKLDYVENKTANLSSDQIRSVIFFGAVVPNLDLYSIDAHMSNYIKRAGGNNCAWKNLGSTSGQGTISAEDLIAYNPDVILANTPPADYATFLADSRLKYVKAITNNQTSITPRGVWGIIGGGVGVIEMPFIQLWLAKVIQPSLFEEVDLSSEIEYFFSNFFQYELNSDGAYRIINAMPPA